MLISVILVIWGAIMISWLELRPVWKARKYKEMWVFILTMTAGVTVFSMELLQVQLFNPLDVLIAACDPVSRIIFSMLS